MTDIKKAFRAAQGLDAANNNVINVSDPRTGELLDGVNQQYFIKENTVQNYSSTRTYKSGFVVIYQGRMYYALEAITTPEAFTVSKWQPVRVDDTWIEMSPITALQANAGDRIHLITSNTTFTVSLPANPLVGETIVMHDRTGQAHLRRVTVNRNSKMIDGVAQDFYINVPYQTVYFYYTNAGWVTSVQIEPRNTIVSVANSTEASPYELAPFEVVYASTASGKLWFQLPLAPNDGDVITMIDADEKNPINYTTLKRHPSATYLIQTVAGNLANIESNLAGEVRFIFDAAANVWRTYSSDIIPREIDVRTDYQSEPFDCLFIRNDINQNVVVTLPQKPFQGNWVDFHCVSNETGSFQIKVHPLSVGISIFGSIESVLKKKYSQIPKVLGDFATSQIITSPSGNHSVEVRLHYNEATKMWIVGPLSYRIDVADEAYPTRPGIIPLAVQADVNKQNYAPDSKTDIVAPDLAVTPKTLDARRSTETLAGLARIATSAETQIVTAGVHRDDLIVTPLKLNARQATETIRGLAEVATQTETRSETLDTHIITPMKFHAAQAEESLTGVTKLVQSGGVARTSRVGNGTFIFDKTNHSRTVTPLVLDQLRATEFQPGMLWIADQAESNLNTEDSPVDNAIITPKKLAARTATETRRGLARLATGAESLATSGSTEAWHSVLITPQTLNNRTATETRRGVVELATQAELDLGTEATHFALTPAIFSTWMKYNHFITAGTDGLRFTGNIWNKVSFTIDAATETQRGTLRVATQAETDVIGTALDTVFVTPKKLDTRRSTTTLYGLARLATDTEIDAASTTIGNVAADPVLVTPANLTRWTRTSANSRSSTALYGVSRNALLSETWTGTRIIGSGQDYSLYLQDSISVTPRGLNYALANYLPIEATAVNSQLLDGLDSTQFARRDIAQTVTGVYTFTGNDVILSGASPRFTFTETDTGTSWIVNNEASVFSVNLNSTAAPKLTISSTAVAVANALTVGGTGLFGGSITENEGTVNGNSPATGTLRTKYLGILNNAVSASKWATARTITFSGDLTGSFVIDGTGNVTASAQVVDGSHNHDAANITSGILDVLRTPQGSTSARGTVQLTDSSRSSSTTQGLSAAGALMLQEQIDTFTPDGGTGISIKYRDYIQVGSVRMSTNSEGIMEFTFGNTI